MPMTILRRIDREVDAGVELVSIGVGMGNFNDVLLEQLADRGNGFYAYVNDRVEAERLFGEQLIGTLQTVARDARVQVEFGPDAVVRYRLLGYENRRIADQDFANPYVDAGEVGAGHSVTALYEIEPLELRTVSRHGPGAMGRPRDERRARGRGRHRPVLDGRRLPSTGPSSGWRRRSPASPRSCARARTSVVTRSTTWPARLLQYSRAPDVDDPARADRCFAARSEAVTGDWHARNPDPRGASVGRRHPSSLTWLSGRATGEAWPLRRRGAPAAVERDPCLRVGGQLADPLGQVVVDEILEACRLEHAAQAARTATQTSRSARAAPAYSTVSTRSPRTLASGPSTARMTSATLMSVGGPGEGIATVGAARALDDPGVLQLEHDRLEELARDVLRLRRSARASAGACRRQRQARQRRERRSRPLRKPSPS